MPRMHSTPPGRPARSLAHVRRNAAGQAFVEHGLVDHLQAVSALARAFAAAFGPDWAAIAGLWHDLGKFRPGFLRFIRGVNGLDAHLEGRLPSGSDKTHSAAGALHALDVLGQRYGIDGRRLGRVLAYVIAGHHAGLADWATGLDPRLLGSGAIDSRREHAEAVAVCRQEAPALLELPASFDLRAACQAIPGVGSANPLALSLWVRMLFSALVDADFLDTERFLEVDRADRRLGFAALADYRDRLDAHLDTKAAELDAAGRGNEPVMAARRQVLAACRAQALGAPGVYTLTVPTGGGKTLSSLAFALTHAVRHGHRRVIYAIPYTSIIEQTADVFAGVFGADAVVEHHSQAEADSAAETPRSRLACENWDAPLVVTTTVQLFESLFASRTSRCRKLHRIAGSVIVLDEAQRLPPRLLQPILDTLQLLTQHYGVTLLLCTATQPVLTDRPRFDPKESLRGLPTPTAVIADEAALFEALRRVRIEWPGDLHTPCGIAELAGRLADEPCVLTIVNTRRDAAELVAALDTATGEHTLHLSAAMCGQHRADVIAELRERLQARRRGLDTRALRVVSTQLIEAGVDVDFPVVYRALTGLDSIAQAAGRCNREGLLPADDARVVVFVRDIPRGLAELRHGAEATRRLVAEGLPDPLRPEAFQRYFPTYYSAFRSRDEAGIGELLGRDARDFSFAFRTAAERFRLVDDEGTVTVFVPYASPRDGARHPSALIAKLRSGGPDRWLMRALQRFAVQLRAPVAAEWQRLGDVDEVVPGCLVLVDTLRYDERLGLLTSDAPIAPETLVA